MRKLKFGFKGEKMNKKKAIINFILLVLLTALIVVMCAVIKKDKEKKNNNVSNEVEIREIMYGSQISSVGYTSADVIASNFVQAYNDKDGEFLVSFMDLVGTYIYSECGKDINKFDQMYEDILAVGSTKYSDEDFLIMQYSLQAEENRMLEAISKVDVQLTLESNTQIEDVTKYISKFTAQIHTESETEGVSQTDTVEFILLKSDDAYHLIDYYAISDGEN
jgi:hypothetical protein